MNKIFFLVGLMFLYILHSGQTLDCYFCVDCDHVNEKTKTATCTNDIVIPPEIAESKDTETTHEKAGSTPESYCIYIQYRLINDREKVDRFCSSKPCGNVTKYDKYKSGSYCEECQQNKCNHNAAGTHKSWPLAALLILTSFKIIFS